MLQDSEKPSRLPIFFLLLLIAAGGFYLYEQPFESSRPKGEPIPLQVLGDEAIPARMWQDPLGAQMRWEQKQSTVIADYKNLLATQSKASDLRSLKILAIMVFGGNYAEQIESRRRYRYAVLSAMAKAGYGAVDPEHIGVFHIKWPKSFENTKGQSICSSINSNDGQSSYLPIPYEWMEQNQALYTPSTTVSKVLILWLNDDLFSDHPLCRLTQLIGNGKSDNFPEHSTFRVIGPAGSTTLRAMIAEAKKLLVDSTGAKKIRDKFFKYDTEIYSATATADAELLLGSSKQVMNECPPIETTPTELTALRQIECLFNKLGIGFFRTIPSDGMLTQEVGSTHNLLGELKRRGVNLANNHHRIALIAEWDTFYGRALPESIIRSFNKLRCSSNNQRQKCDTGVKRYSYMRGLDGELPPSTIGSSESSEESKDKSTRNHKHLERASGNQRLDYLRRLANQMVADIASSPETELKAIGVLGSDVYDKLLVLQALRPRFPRALFFTTDLDVRYTHPVEYPWTRNLLVVSGFGLHLNHTRQGEIPPFRDSYQTSYFFATQLALKQGSSRDARRLWLTDQLKPRLFEIGRWQTVDLSTTETDIHPPAASFPFWYWQILGKWLLVILALVLPTFFFMRFFETPLSLWRAIKIITALLSPLILVIVLIQLQGPEGEPFSLWAGISLWPRELLQLYAILAAIVFMRQISQQLKVNTYQMEEKHGSKGKTASTWIRCPWILYRRLVCGRSRWRRIGISASGWTLMLIGLFWLGSPAGLPYFSPFRGALSFWSDLLISFTAAFAFLVLSFQLFDTAFMTRHLVKHLIRRKIPEKELVHFIGDHTKIFDKIIYYPFLTLFLLVVARSSLFDWEPQKSFLFIFFILGFVLSFGSTLLLRKVAEQVRQHMLERLQSQLYQAVGSNREKIIRISMEEIQSYNKGAFCPLPQQPVLKALLLPFGGMSGVAFLEYLIRIL